MCRWGRMIERFQCAEASKVRNESLAATASVVGGWLAVEVRGAWGSDAPLDSALGDHVSADFVGALRRQRIRVVTIRAQRRRHERRLCMYLATVRLPGMEPAVLWGREFDTLAEVEEVVGAADLAALHAGGSPGAGWAPAEPIFLICTNGRHDQCCANAARPVIRRLAASRWASRVWECSHIGGDRFAPNMVALPQSWYFGRFDTADLDDLLGAIDNGDIDLRYFRGRTAFSVLQQTLEHEVRAHLAAQRPEAPSPGGEDVSITTLGHAQFRVDIAGLSFLVQVRHELVTAADPLTCHGLPSQQIDRYSVTSIHPLDSQ